MKPLERMKLKVQVRTGPHPLAQLPLGKLLEGGRQKFLSHLKSECPVRSPEETGKKWEGEYLKHLKNEWLRFKQWKK